MKIRALFFAVAMVLGVESFAVTWNPFKGEGRVKAHTILVTGNFVKSRVLTELAQYFTKQPMLLVSQDADGSSQFFYMPTCLEAQSVTPAELAEVLGFINPKRAIVIGGDKYVPKTVVEQLKAKCPVVTIESDDWMLNATTLSQIMNAPRLQEKYQEFSHKLPAN